MRRTIVVPDINWDDVEELHTDSFPFLTPEEGYEKKQSIIDDANQYALEEVQRVMAEALAFKEEFDDDLAASIYRSASKKGVSVNEYVQQYLPPAEIDF